ncbi:Cyclodextrin-binding protein [Paenibacillus plantiphilus]|uniref:Maltodextrin-binding protein n=1 Tax=Paenibacillus plantiphilus TaxID=2905650 RepID=A0ABN8G7Y3_9BACL|nr:maltose ABC transporter substrate-binding protein [Paenibacillus plantiphilus]CAH1197913.1 Cyclodextrin-binding protein [Paenibacillus plantiphilus]
MKRKQALGGLAKVSLFVLTLSLVITTACSNNANDPNDSKGTGNTPDQSKFDLTFNKLETDLVPEPGASLLIWESKEARPFVEAIMKEFTAAYGVEVRMQELGTMDQIGKFELDGPAGLAADVITTSQDHLGKAASAGLILPNDEFEEATRSEHEAVAVTAGSYNNKLYGYPIKVMTYAMFYNKDLISKPPATMEEVIAFSKTFTDPDRNKYAFMFDAPFFYFSYPFIGSTGGYIFGNNGTDPADIGLNNEGAVKGMEVFASLRKEVLPISAGDIASDIKTTLFSEGSVAMNVTGSWFIETFRQAGINFGVAPIPAIGGNDSVTLSQVNSWYVSAYSKYPNAAKLFARFASNKSAQLLNYELTGAVPTHKEAAQNAVIQGDEITSTFYKQFSNSHSAPSIPEISSVWVPMDAAMVEIWDGNDGKEVLDRAVKQIRDAMSLNAKQGDKPSEPGSTEAPF